MESKSGGLDMKNVLITGANGFIGSTLIKCFSEKGYSAVGWDIVEGKQYGVRVQSVDLNDEQLVIEKLIEVNPDIIIHCAGSADVGKSVQNPEIDYKGNVTLTHNLLFSLHKLKMENTRFVFLSSAAVYGNPISLPIREEAQLNPLSPYALHKVMCEEICKYMVNNYCMDIKILRIFSAYGKGLKKQIFWDMFQKAERTGNLEMFGTGLESRDYIEIHDVINAIFLVATKAPKDELIYNVANGFETTIREAAETFADCYGILREKISFMGSVREGDPIVWKADITKLKVLGYIPTISFHSGIKGYVDWVISLI